MASRDPVRLGALIRTAREQLGLSRREAEKLTSFSRTTWTSLETGTRIKQGGGAHEDSKAKPHVIIEAAEVLGVDVNEALTLGGWDPRIYNPDSTPSLARRVSLLSSEQQAAVSWVVDAFLAAEVPAQAQEAVAGVIAAFEDAGVPPQSLSTPEPEQQPRTRRGAARMSAPRRSGRHAVMSSRRDETAATPDDIPESRRAGSRT